MALASPLRATASRLIRKFGEPCVFRRIETGAFNPATDSAPTTPIDVTAQALATDISLREARGMVRVGDKRLLVAATDLEGQRPKPDWRVAVRDRWHEVVDVAEVGTEGQAVIYTLLLRGT